MSSNQPVDPNELLRSVIAQLQQQQQQQQQQQRAAGNTSASATNPRTDDLNERLKNYLPMQLQQQPPQQVQRASDTTQDFSAVLAVLASCIQQAANNAAPSAPAPWAAASVQNQVANDPSALLRESYLHAAGSTGVSGLLRPLVHPMHDAAGFAANQAFRPASAPAASPNNLMWVNPSAVTAQQLIQQQGFLQNQLVQQQLQPLQIQQQQQVQQQQQQVVNQQMQSMSQHPPPRYQQQNTDNSASPDSERSAKGFHVKKRTVPHLPSPSITSASSENHVDLTKDEAPSSSVASNANYASPAAAVASASSALSPQNWTLKQLESYAKRLADSNQSMPQSIEILLANARRKQQKNIAKKLANNKAAKKSRSRKKDRINAMAQDNVMLRRQAVILSFLPDAVVAISTDGEITFSSIQMEKVLRRTADDLIGLNIEQFIVPDSQIKFRKMVQDLLIAEEEATQDLDKEESKMGDANGNEHGNYSSRSSDHNVISLLSLKQSVPTEEVKVDSSEVICNSSAELMNAKPSFNLHHNDGIVADTEVESAPPLAKRARITKGSGVDSSSLTENNVASILSSLHHHEGTATKPPVKRSPQGKQLMSCLRRKLTSASPDSSSSDSLLSKTTGQFLNSSDSGYMASNRSQEESTASLSSATSSADGSLQKLHKQGIQGIHPLAPSCRICLIRNNGSMIWCELTASIRTRSITDGDFEESMFKKSRAMGELKELLLCFRPIRRRVKVEEELGLDKKRIRSPKNHELDSQKNMP